MLGRRYSGICAMQSETKLKHAAQVELARPSHRHCEQSYLRQGQFKRPFRTTLRSCFAAEAIQALHCTLCIVQNVIEYLFHWLHCIRKNCRWPVVRCKSLASSSFSSRAIDLLTAEGVVPNWRAASEKLPHSTIFAKMTISPIREVIRFVRIGYKSMSLCVDCGSRPLPMTILITAQPLKIDFSSAEIG